MKPDNLLVLRFQGLASTRRVQQNLLDADAIEHVLGKAKDPYIGRVPDGITQQTRLPQKAVLQILDQLACQLTPPPQRSLVDRIKMALNIKRFMKTPQTSLITTGIDPRFKVERVGSGNFGTVYRLAVGTQVYAFKVMHAPRKSRQNLLEEVAIGTYFTAQPTKDMSQLYIANAQQGWLLMEFIDENTDYASRPGKTLKEQGIDLDDDKRSNFIKRIRVDYGGDINQDF